MYNPLTDSVVLSRYVKWANWVRADPTATLKQLQESEPPLEAAPPDLTQTASLTNPHFIPEEDDHDAGRIDGDNRQTIVGSRTRSNQHQFQNIVEDDEPLQGAARRARAKLDTYYNPAPNEIEDEIPIVEDDDEDIGQTKMINIVMSITMSDPGEPKSIDSALHGPKGNEWRESIKSEINNFISQDAWRKVPLKDVLAEGRKPIKTKTVFKTKDEHDGSQRLKSRIMTLGYSMVPGQDYTDSFSSVATDASVRTFFAISLYIMNQTNLHERIE
jgi:hypothetical protein